MDKTYRIYRDNVYSRECESVITDVLTDTEGPGSVCLILDKTIFFPEGGGQTSDSGVIRYNQDEYPVVYVFEKDDIIYHQIQIENKKVPQTGNKVFCMLDWQKRFINMQRHCGEHILSTVFYDLYGGINQGFHMGSDYMTIDISMEEKQITDEMIIKAEWEANKMIWDNLPVTYRHFKTRKEAEHLPMRKALNVDKDITLVCIGDENKPAGCVACCGTHPNRTGEVGMIKIYRWENYKGMVRITFDAGPIALKHCQDQAYIVKELCHQFSSNPESLMAKIRKQDEKNKQQRQELYEIKKIYHDRLTEELMAEIEQLSDDKVLIKQYEALSTDDLLKISRVLKNNIPKDKLIVLTSVKEKTLLLLSDGTKDCGKTVKDNAGVWKGKGGGKSDSARAMFPSIQDMNCFLDYLGKAW